MRAHRLPPNNSNSFSLFLLPFLIDKTGIVDGQASPCGRHERKHEEVRDPRVQPAAAEIRPEADLEEDRQREARVHDVVRLPQGGQGDVSAIFRLIYFHGYIYLIGLFRRVDIARICIGARWK